MNQLFGSDNVFYVPQGRPFKIFDLLLWRTIEIDVQALRILLSAQSQSLVADKASIALDNLEVDGHPAGEEAQEDAHAQMQVFLASLPYQTDLPECRQKISAALAPYPTTLWVNLSQAPAESFFAEDYIEAGEIAGNLAPVQSCYGSIAFNAMGEDSCDLPGEKPCAFQLAAPEEMPIARLAPIDPLEPLPLIREFCGHTGASSQGRLVTLDLNSAIPPEALAAVPICRSESSIYFQTLYLHLGLESSISSALPFKSTDMPRIGKALKSAGFKPKAQTRRFSAWTRGGDIIQIYRNLEGKEASGIPVLPPFCLAAHANGSTDLAPRHTLLREIFPSFF